MKKNPIAYCKQPSFPSEIYLKWEPDTFAEEGGYWIPYTDKDEMADLGKTVLVGKYKLTDKCAVKTTVEIA